MFENTPNERTKISHTHQSLMGLSFETTQEHSAKIQDKHLNFRCQICTTKFWRRHSKSKSLNTPQTSYHWRK